MNHYSDGLRTCVNIKGNSKANIAQCNKYNIVTSTSAACIAVSNDGAQISKSFGIVASSMRATSK